MQKLTLRMLIKLYAYFVIKIVYQAFTNSMIYICIRNSVKKKQRSHVYRESGVCTMSIVGRAFWL